MERLFDDFERSNPYPAADDEDSFAFMNRVAQPFWARIRKELDHWFEAYPEDQAPDLRARFRDRAPAQHFAAWWELYLHELFRRLGFEVEVHPSLAGVGGRPDFRMTREDEAFLLEAATTFSGIVSDEERHGERESWIKAAINEVKNPNFFVALDFERVGTERPSVREIAEPIGQWLDALDPDAVGAMDFEDAPQLRLRPRDWDFVLTAIPVKAEARGRPGHRLLGISTGIGGFVNDREMIGRTLERKRRKYGKPEEPLVMAMLLMSAFMENEDVEQALLGHTAYQFDPGDFQRGQWIRQRNGFWMRGTEARNTRLSGLLTGTNLMPWTAARIWPRLWPNPWARRPLTLDLPFPTAMATDTGLVRYQEVDDPPAALFGLDAQWPGPEGRFEGI